jgi:hypothetical protein
VQYLTSAASNKEDIARRIAATDHVERGLICVLTAVEPCWSFEIVRDRASKRIGQNRGIASACTSTTIGSTSGSGS